ncbi:hypothetical protein [Martelella mediterranea]|uniref:Uncharacterized protein n=1 Tax=Martelella mediterranea DSM 17316 TaxID=1122214 RepID=A0A1U9Z2M3_9HYPH|nr:hypothetical protein [Martelella mediterranea]AQZ51941.1 hypothetical protein Mame_02615 [Martelella mediterranea DSM 17316]
MSDKKESKQAFADRVVRTVNDAKRGDETLWRHPVAEAVMALFAAGRPVTPESLIEQIKNTMPTGDPVLGDKTSGAAIERLQQFVGIEKQ